MLKCEENSIQRKEKKKEKKERERESKLNLYQLVKLTNPRNARIKKL